MSERRRPTMGERGAPPDPILGIRYGQACDCGKYCDCDMYGDRADNDTGPEPESGESKSSESEGWSAADTAVTAGAVAGAGVIVGLLGPVGVPIAAVLGGGLVVRRWFGSRK